MKLSIKRITVGLGIASLALSAVIAYNTYAIASQAGQPTAVVSVNLAMVMEKLDQWSDSAARLRKLRDDLTAEQDRRTKDLDKLKEDGKKLQEQLDAATDESKRQALDVQMQALQENAAMETLNFQAWVAFSAEKADIEAALATQDLYRSIKSAVAQMALANKFDVVLVDDSQGELAISGDARISRVQQVQQQIAGRRTLYINPAIDITDDLIQRMNNARKQAGAKAP